MLVLALAAVETHVISRLWKTSGLINIGMKSSIGVVCRYHPRGTQHSAQAREIVKDCVSLCSGFGTLSGTAFNSFQK